MTDQKQPDHMMIEQIGKRLYGKCWQTDLARAIGVSQSYVHFMASGRRPVSPEVWKRVYEMAGARQQEAASIQSIIRRMDVLPKDVRHGS